MTPIADIVAIKSKPVTQKMKSHWCCEPRAQTRLHSLRKMRYQMVYVESRIIRGVAWRCTNPEIFSFDACAKLTTQLYDESKDFRQFKHYRTTRRILASIIGKVCALTLKTIASRRIRWAGCEAEFAAPLLEITAA